MLIKNRNTFVNIHHLVVFYQLFTSVVRTIHKNIKSYVKYYSKL